MRNFISLFLMFILIAYSLTAQSFSSDKWEIDAAESRIENHLGKESLYIKGGVAVLKDAEFLNGIIECKVAFTGARGFMGLVWRFQDRYNFEEFYVRPHQSGKPDANQYTPVFNGLPGWQLYYGKEYSAPVKYKNNEWNHLKIIISGKYAEFYINDMNSPAFFVSELKREVKSGLIGVECGNFAPAHFTDFRYTSVDNPEFAGTPKLINKPEPGTVVKWQVSNHFNEAELDEKYILDSDDKDGMNWTAIECEHTGFVNLARVQGTPDGLNTAYARVVIDSESDQIKKIRFGYSDRVKVFVNDKLVYGGQNNYMSRDYRYLGTIGLFDELYLPLKKGTNEIRFAVSESFGGWGITAKFDNLEGINLKN